MVFDPTAPPRPSTPATARVRRSTTAGYRRSSSSQMAQLAPGQGDGLAVPLDRPGRRVVLEVAHRQLRPQGHRRAALQGPDPSQELGQAERLDQVVVGPGIEPFDPVGGGVAGRQHKMGTGSPGAAPGAPPRSPRGRHPPVEHHRLVLVAGCAQRPLPVGHRVDHVARLRRPRSSTERSPDRPRRPAPARNRSTFPDRPAPAGVRRGAGRCGGPPRPAEGRSGPRPGRPRHPQGRGRPRPRRPGGR